MHVGLLINNGGQFVNGSEQQAQFLIELLELLGVPLTVYTHVGADDACGTRRSADFHGTPLQLLADADLAPLTHLIMIAHICDNGPTSEDLRRRLAHARCVQFHCGNHCLFNAEDVVFGKHDVVRLLRNTWFAESWVFEMHHFAAAYYEMLTTKPCRLMPYVWSPTLLDRHVVEHRLDVACDPALYGGPLTLCCFEPNLNTTKTCLAPLLVMDALYRKHPERVHRCFIFCAQHLLQHRAFPEFLAFLAITRDKKVELYPRMPLPDVLAQLKAKRLAPVVIGHQMCNAQNYLSLEVLHLGYPLLHNSPPIATAGLYYDEWDLHAALRALERLQSDFVDRHDDYRRRARAALRAHAPAHPTNLAAFRRLLEAPAL